MNKAILVIDMPECCNECRFLNDNYDYPECIVTGETKGYTFKAREQKMDKCPLKPLPEKYDIEAERNKPHDRDCDWEFESGYNQCINEILDTHKNEVLSDCVKETLIFPHTIGDITYYSKEELIKWVEDQ